MRIPIIFADKRRGLARADELQEMILMRKVVCFQRGHDGWVKVGVDPIRGMGGRRYRGPERRGNIISNC